MINAFSIDVEDGVSIAMRDRFGVAMRQTERVLINTRRILELLGQSDTKATFFILGQVAEVFPQLVREIAAGGHEIGVHGYDHLLFSQMTPAQAFDEVSRAKEILEDVAGTKVIGHRAPCFSINPSTAWGLDVLYEAGFEYDSSIMPCSGVGYGWPGHSLDIGPVGTPEGASMIEVPLTVTSVLGRNVPALGGSYFRLLPYATCRRILRRVQSVRPAIVYLHPYELDTDVYPDYYFEKLKAAPLLTQARMRSFWLRRRSLASRYERLLKEHNFAPIRDLISKKQIPSSQAGVHASSDPR
jgi:polysaccharide deacetylase family protein (PEP-CTERM system associated)